MAKTATVIITSSIEGKGAYGITTDTDENVYFPVKMTEMLGLEEFETVQAVVVANDRAEPPLRAIHARGLNEED